MRERGFSQYLDEAAPGQPDSGGARAGDVARRERGVVGHGPCLREARGRIDAEQPAVVCSAVRIDHVATVQRDEPSRSAGRWRRVDLPGAVGIDQATIEVRLRSSRPITRTIIRKLSA